MGPDRGHPEAGVVGQADAVAAGEHSHGEPGGVDLRHSGNDGSHDGQGGHAGGGSGAHAGAQHHTNEEADQQQDGCHCASHDSISIDVQDFLDDFKRHLYFV